MKYTFFVKYCLVLAITTISVINIGTKITYSIFPKKQVADNYGYFHKIPYTYKEIARSAALQCNTDPKVYHFLIQHESAWDVNALSSAGAMSLSQLMPKTAKYMGIHNPWNANDNLIGGACYLSILFAQYGNMRLALYAYNAGPGNLRRGKIGDGTRKYANKIINDAITHDLGPEYYQTF